MVSGFVLAKKKSKKLCCNIDAACPFLIFISPRFVHMLGEYDHEHESKHNYQYINEMSIKRSRTWTHGHEHGHVHRGRTSEFCKLCATQFAKLQLLCYKVT